MKTGNNLHGHLKWMNQLIFVHSSNNAIHNLKKQNISIDTYTWISKSWWIKKAKLKRIHTVWFHLYEVLEQTHWYIVIEIWSTVAVEELGGENNCKEHEVNFWGNEMFFVITGVRLHRYEYCSKSYNCTENVCIVLHISFTYDD